MDEVHHAHAPSYRRVLARLNAGFILGLTATPERADGSRISHPSSMTILPIRLRLGTESPKNRWCRFTTSESRITVDFREIPWRNGRFSVDELEDRVIRSERMDRCGGR